MFAFIGLTVALFLGLVYSSAYMQRYEIIANWSKYKLDPFYMFAAPMFKPDDDPRSRLQFATDNFNDNLKFLLDKVFAVLLQPVFAIFKLFNDAIGQSLNGLFNVKALLAQMWKKWNSMSDVFTRRTHGLFHQLRKTFMGLFNAMEKAYGVATASLFAGISTIHTMTSVLDLVIKICIAILVILVVLVILLFFVLAPFVPMLLTVVGIIGATAAGGAVGGMADSFCFTKETRVLTKDGVLPISQLTIGQALHGDNTVVGIIELLEEEYNLYDIDGVFVSGSHILYVDGKPMMVEEHPHAKPIVKTAPLYCLVTSQQRIHIQGVNGVLEFADWEEIEEMSDLLNWYNTVYITLNKEKAPWVPAETLHSEAVVSEFTQIDTPIGIRNIEHIRPGDYVNDVYEFPTKVLGVVEIAPSEVLTAAQYGASYISTGAWISKYGRWIHPHSNTAPPSRRWFSLFTEQGTFTMHTPTTTIALRDFTDVGSHSIHIMYSMVMDALKREA